MTAQQIDTLASDEAATEQRQLATLLQNGLTISTPKRSLLRYFGAKERTWHLKQPYLGTLEYLIREMSQLEDLTDQAGVIDRQRLAQTPKNFQRCARIVAIAILDNWWGLTFLTPFMSRYLANRITPDELIALVGIINHMANYPAFIGAIELMKVAPRITQPSVA
ncbi:hypothetical protein FAES_0363 [Fibrella aestuarina BUZ 2]|uniref:Uncharacterized protein n=1 Tax=Fibrella aestuarina BUZ 2 TaxID=1166018 RepID=I0K2M3_9BACT|nr:hypothetical protein [Fibrella aestuarina]CCG98376.1 hypothetical protein FAES_0363 [Fibrella aestuarina BUZ 2]